MLTPAQIKQYREDGYLVIDDVIPMDEVEKLREAADDPNVRRALDSSGFEDRTVHLMEITAKHPAFRELCRDPRITGLLTPLLGEDIQLQHSKLATKPPKKDAGEFAWHQDYAFFPHTNCDLMAVMVMLDDATPENGCMSIVKGSHKLGVLNHLRDGYFVGMCLEDKYWSDPAQVVPLTPKAGGISIHHGLTLHASPANLSGRPRRGVVFEYRASDAHQLAGNVFADTGLQVRGQFRECVRCDAGSLRLPGRRHWNPPYGNHYFQVGRCAAEWNRAGDESRCSVAETSSAMR
jgi:ectoine hydroxylase-related dioxygenase (phytanoyl-CoA dioxygenase family)